MASQAQDPASPGREPAQAAPIDFGSSGPLSPGGRAPAARSLPPAPPESTAPLPELLKIGDFARLADTNLRTLRYYEELGLLEPARRSQGGFRYYRPTDLNRLRMIRDLQELGLSLDAIRELLATRQEGLPRREMLARVARALDEQQRLIQKRIQELEAQVDGLKLARIKLEACGMCSHSPTPWNNHCEPCTATGEELPKPLSALF